MLHKVTLHWAECDKCNELYGHEDEYDDEKDLFEDMEGDGWYFEGEKVLCDECRKK